ncbi:MAG: amino acid ABC transporter permease, partial [Clostridia bacterium]|nr:amino acid ABC transporter permease [Clostridia bacterium]
MSIWTMMKLMSQGLGRTCSIFFLTLLIALPLGLIVSLLRMSKNKVVSSVVQFIIAVLRGTPLM